MAWLKVLGDLYALVMEALSFALTDPEFHARWIKLETDVEALGIDIPGFEPSPVQHQASQENPPNVVTNDDGSISLEE